MSEQVAGLKRYDLRLFWRALAVIGAVGVLALVSGLAYGRWSGAQRLTGTDLGRIEAPGFSLTNQDGRQVALSDIRGKPVVLTFLYTHCPDVCPIIADKLRQALDQMGQDAASVSIIAVSTDPRQDDRLSVVRFTEQHGLTGRWNYLVGSPGQVQPVWQSYYIAAQDLRDIDPAQGVMHSAVLFFIDKQGRERVLTDADFVPDDVVHNLRALSAE